MPTKQQLLKQIQQLQKTPPTTGQVLKQLMKLHGITSLRLAAHLGTHPNYVGSALRGRHCVAKGKYWTPGPALLERLRQGIIELVEQDAAGRAGRR